MNKAELERIIKDKSPDTKVYTDPTEGEILEALGEDAVKPHGDTNGEKFARIDKEELATRRVKVQKLVMRGFRKEKIAEFLGIHVKTVYADLKVVKKQIRENVMQMDYPLFVGETMTFYDEVKQIALRMATNPEEIDKKVKLAALREATNAEDSKHRFLTQAGMYKAINPDMVYSDVKQGDTVSMQDVLQSIEAKLSKVSTVEAIESFIDEESL